MSKVRPSVPPSIVTQGNILFEPLEWLVAWTAPLLGFLSLFFTFILRWSKGRVLTPPSPQLPQETTLNLYNLVRTCSLPSIDSFCVSLATCHRTSQRYTQWSAGISSHHGTAPYVCLFPDTLNTWTSVQWCHTGTLNFAMMWVSHYWSRRCYLRG